MERRLAAILAADVAGYSRLMGEDEEGTLARLNAYREIIDSLIGTHHGRVFGSAGDSVIAEFASPVQAVRCATKIQLELGKRNADLPENRHMRLRIGINLGDVMVDGDNLLGDGVNVAARIQEIAAPGGVCVSGTVHEHVTGKIDIVFENLGEQKVKNIPKPVRVYRWTDATAAQGADTTVTESALPLPDKPSIAVLPFINMSGDPEQEYFSDGITEDIITELSRFRSLFVIARSSSFTYKGQAINAIDIGRTLGVQYIVEGSVRKAGNRVRVTAQLVEAATGNHLWAERYDREIEDLFAVQDELVRTITATLGGRVDSAGQMRAERLSKTDLQVYDLVLRAYAAWLRSNKKDNRHARELLERAIDLDPRSAQAYLTITMVHLSDWLAHWVVDRDAALVAAFECGKRAVALDDTHSMAQANLGMAYMFRREFDDARHCFERALALNPNDSIALGYFAIYLTAVGRVDEAFTQFDQSTRINPLQPDWVDWLKGIAFFTARRYDEAIASLRTIKDPINEVRGWLAANYAGAGRLDEARITLEEFLRVAEEDMAVFPGRKMAAWEPYWRGAGAYQNEADFEHLFTALRKAGLEE